MNKQPALNFRHTFVESYKSDCYPHSKSRFYHTMTTLGAATASRSCAISIPTLLMRSLCDRKSWMHAISRLRYRRPIRPHFRWMTTQHSSRSDSSPHEPETMTVLSSLGQVKPQWMLVCGSLMRAWHLNKSVGFDLAKPGF